MLSDVLFRCCSSIEFLRALELYRAAIMAAAKPGKPGRGAGGRDAAYEKVKLIVPDCTDEEVQQALQQSLGDADQAVIALTDSASRNSGLRPRASLRQVTDGLCLM